jgi:hypothetical protein
MFLDKVNYSRRLRRRANTNGCLSASREETETKKHPPGPLAVSEPERFSGKMN